MRFFSVLMAFGVSFLAASARAQNDFARQLLSSGHYELRKGHGGSEAPVKKNRRPASTVENPTEVQVPASPSMPVMSPALASAPALVSAPMAPAVAKTAEANPIIEGPREASTATEPSLKEQVQSLWAPSDEQIQKFYEEQVHPDDVRLNKVEIDLMPGISFNDSRSNYSYRNYQASYSAVQLRSNVWLTPLVGLTGSLKFSLGASLKGNSTTNSMVPARYEDMDLGLKFRRFFGLSRRSNSLETSLLYTDGTLNVAADSVDRTKIRSSGLGLGVHLRLPSSAQFAWVIGGSFFPRLQHSENKAGLSISSGASAENIRMGLDFGGEIRFNRGNQFLYNLNFKSERNLFEGTASPADPENAQTPSNVTVTNSSTSFSFGYRWGN